MVFPGSGWWSTHASTYSNKQDWISRLNITLDPTGSVWFVDLWFLLNSDNVASLHSSLSPRSRLATKLSRDRGRWRRESECYYVDCWSSLGSWMENNHWEETTIKIGWKKKNGRMKETFTPNREYIRKSNDTESSFYGELFLFHPRKMSTCR